MPGKKTKGFKQNEEDEKTKDTEEKKTANDLFKEYSVETEDYIDAEGLLNFYNALGISLDDPFTIIFPYYCSMANYVFLFITLG